MVLRSIAASLLLASAVLAAPPSAGAAPGTIEISPARVRGRPGDRIEFRVSQGDAMRALLVTPGAGARPIPIERLPTGEHRVVVALPTEAVAGLYLLHVWTGDERQPAGLGKAVILAGPIVLDFFLPAYLDAANPRKDLSAYLDDLRSIGGNTLIAHALITPDRAFFPSAIARTIDDARRDAVEDVLSEADRRGLAVFLSVSWDMTHPAPYSDRMRQITALMREMFERYSHHPSLAGFYSYQEGSGTYYVPYVREFSTRVKALNAGLLSACAPFVDDPLLAGYLSMVDALDMVIFQAQVMASYRPDNRKKYPLRRVRDFSALSVGAKWLQDKIAVTHVEVFGYLENRPDPAVIAASYEHIFGQIASVATTPGADGLALFAYHPHIWSPRANPKVQRSRQAVVDGLAAFLRVQRASGSYRNPLAVYFPYSDWIVERWTTSILPGLDGLRQAGVPVDILPYAPRPDESEYPYFPFHHNPAVLERLLANRRVLVLPDVSGFQQTDSDLIAPFVDRGGVLVAFGPQIPMGRTFERDQLFGAHETTGTTGRTIRVPRAFGRRTKDGETCAVPAAPTTAWRATTARVLATFEDGSPAILANASGKGLAVAFLPSIQDLAGGCSNLLRDVLELAQTHAGTPVLADVVGLSAASDVAIAPTPDGIAIAIVNHEATARPVTVRPIDVRGTWVDDVSGHTLPAGSNAELSIDVPAGGLQVVRLKKQTGGP